MLVWVQVCHPHANEIYSQHCPTCAQKHHRLSLMTLGHVFNLFEIKPEHIFCLLVCLDGFTVKFNMQHFLFLQVAFGLLLY